MYKIGDFSRLCQVSVKTLHHYDDVGLVRPARVDRESGYRFYEAAQVAQVRRIRNLRALGFSLEEIAEVLDGHVASRSLPDSRRGIGAAPAASCSSIQRLSLATLGISLRCSAPMPGSLE